MWFYLALLSAFFNALANIARRTHGSLAQPAELSWWSLLLGMPLNIGLVLISHEPLWTSSAYLMPAIIAGSINAYGGVLIFKAYKYGDASVISPIGNLIPIALLITSFLILGITPSLIGFIGILLVVAGVYYSSVNGKHSLLHPLWQLTKNKGSRAMLGWVVLMSISTVFVKIALTHASVAYTMLFIMVYEFLILSIYLLLSPRRHRLKHGERVMKRWGWHIAAIAVFGALTVFFQFQAINFTDPSYVLAVKRLDVLMTILLAGLFLKERHILRRFKGSLLALLGVAVIVFAH